MSRAVHSKKELHQMIDSLPEQMVTDGVILYAPKTEAKYRIKNPHKRFVMTCDEKLTKEFEVQRDRYYSIMVNVGLAQATMLELLKRPTDEEIRTWSEQ